MAKSYFSTLCFSGVGINEIEITSQCRTCPGFITSSVAKMNEYYLHNADFAKRRCKFECTCMLLTTMATYTYVLLTLQYVTILYYYYYYYHPSMKIDTMCHELGHGFGLPHTDENFHNKDLGNCLDYTVNPENNLHPGAINLDRLRDMYWNNESATAAPTLAQSVSVTSTQQQQGNNDGNYEIVQVNIVGDGGGGGERRYLRRVVLKRYLYLHGYDANYMR